MLTPGVVKGPVVSDTFNRANSTSGLGTADTGQAWTTVVGPWGINSDQAYIPTSPAPNTALATIPALSDGIFDVTFSVADTVNSQALVFRYQDTNNWWEVVNANGSGTVGNNVSLWKSVAGTTTNVTTAAHTWANGDQVRVITLGSSIQVYINGTQVMTASDSALQTATLAGLRGQTTTGRWDALNIQGSMP